ncbi:MAG: Lrp/AsnC family transcriptional regulator [Proteobacteria bacterium]|nr:Lrp/AsnC family transcriptional regulator [Pseudomonadota bacterium]
MDDIDRRIACLLQTDNRLSNAEIGAAVGLSVSAANERVCRLNSSGVIRGNHAVLDPERVDLPLCAFVFVDLAPHPDETGFRAAIAARPEVQEVHQVAGPHCYLVKIRVSGTRALQSLLTHQIKSQPHVLRTETVMVLETVKESSQLALPTSATSVPVREDT